MAKNKKKAPWNRRQKIVTAIRKIWKNSPMRATALKLACVDLTAPSRLRLYTCAVCGGQFLGQMMDVDHKIAAPKNEDIGAFIDRMFLGVTVVSYTDEQPKVGDIALETLCKEHLDVVCVNCHKVKTKQENKARRGKT